MCREHETYASLDLRLAARSNDAGPQDRPPRAPGLYSRRGPAAHGVAVEEVVRHRWCAKDATRSEEHTSELQSQSNLVCRLLLEKKNSRNYEMYALLDLKLAPLFHDESPRKLLQTSLDFIMPC